jgi:DNA-binding NarL/FixJ family response regulator
VVERTPDVVIVSGPAAESTVRELRDLHPGLPVIVAAPTAELKALAASFAAEPVVLLRRSGDARDVALTARALASMFGRAPAPVQWDLTSDAKSYAHLAGLLPRALARTFDFDAAAGVVARNGQEPTVDVYAPSEMDPGFMEAVRERAMALFRLVAGGAQPEQDATTVARASPLRSSLYVPLTAGNRVVGLTYLASRKANAFTHQDQRVLADLAGHASGAYRRLEEAVSQLRVTPRQQQVLALIAAGLSDREVADKLGLAHRTVRTHLDRLLREHGLHSRTEAVAAWLRGKQG